MTKHSTTRAIENTANDFQTQAAWLAEQRNFISFDRDALEERGDWLVVPYTYCPNVAEILDESNWAALCSKLADADPTGETYEIQHFGHWATPYDRIIVAPNSAAHGAMAEAMCSYADYPVLDESDFSEREHAATLDNITSELRRATVERNGVEVDSEELAGELFSWFWDNDQSAVECNGGSGGYPSSEQISEGLEGLGYVLCDDDTYRPESETDSVESE